MECEWKHSQRAKPKASRNKKHKREKNYENQHKNSHVPVVREQVLFETFPTEDQQALGILVKPVTIKIEIRRIKKTIYY